MYAAVHEDIAALIPADDRGAMKRMVTCGVAVVAAAPADAQAALYAYFDECLRFKLAIEPKHAFDLLTQQATFTPGGPHGSGRLNKANP